MNSVRLNLSQGMQTKHSLHHDAPRSNLRSRIFARPDRWQCTPATRKRAPGAELYLVQQSNSPGLRCSRFISCRTVIADTVMITVVAQPHETPATVRCSTRISEPPRASALATMWIKRGCLFCHSKSYTVELFAVTTR
jgi:hypothetical protein